MRWAGDSPKQNACQPVRSSEQVSSDRRLAPNIGRGIVTGRSLRYTRATPIAQVPAAIRVRRLMDEPSIRLP